MSWAAKISRPCWCLTRSIASPIVLIWMCCSRNIVHGVAISCCHRPGAWGLAARSHSSIEQRFRRCRSAHSRGQRSRHRISLRPRRDPGAGISRRSSRDSLPTPQTPAPSHRRARRGDSVYLAGARLWFGFAKPEMPFGARSEDRAQRHSRPITPSLTRATPSTHLKNHHPRDCGCRSVPWQRIHRS